MKTMNTLISRAVVALSLIAVLQAGLLFAGPASLKWQIFIGRNNPGSPAIGPEGEILVAVSDAIFAIRDQVTNAVVVSSNRFPKGVQGGVVVRPDGVAYLPGIALGPEGLLAFDFLHGLASQRWVYDPSNAAGFASTPAIGPNGTVYAVTGDGDLHAITSEGDRDWVYDRGAAAANNKVSPAVSADGTVYFRQFGSQIHAVTPTGTNYWTRPLLDQITSSPAIGTDGTIYVCAATWVFALNPTDGLDRWPPCSLNHTVVGSSPALGPDGTLFVGADKRLFALDTRTGTQVADSYLTQGVIYSSPAIAADGVVYFGSDDNSFYAMRLANGILSKLDSYTTGGRVQSAPAIAADGTVYVTSDDGNLYAFQGTVGPARSAWPMFHQNAQRTGLAPRNPSLSLTQGTNGTFRIRVLATADRRTMIEASADFIHWGPVYTNTANTNQFDYLELPSGPSTKRFFRAVVR